MNLECSPHNMKFVDTFLSAVSNTESSRLTGYYAKNGLIKVISDNFDAHIHTQNGLKQTNAMATIVIQSYSTPSASLHSPHDRP